MADLAAGTWTRGGVRPGGGIMTQVSTTHFASMGATGVVQQTFGIGTAIARLAHLVVSSTDCADLDVWISLTTGTGGNALIYSNNSLASATVNGVAYTQYMNQAPNVPFVAAAIATGELGVYVRLTNNDAGVRSAIVRATWEMV